ncbi:MAG: hypothetical protein GC131_06080 [Alphaproteobacteria bacterium]|nr:hypothetical protein [Alphaproteobacteria bacterium]
MDATTADIDKLADKTKKDTDTQSLIHAAWAAGAAFLTGAAWVFALGALTPGLDLMWRVVGAFAASMIAVPFIQHHMVRIGILREQPEYNQWGRSITATSLFATAAGALTASGFGAHLVTALMATNPLVLAGMGIVLAGSVLGISAGSLLLSARQGGSAYCPSNKHEPKTTREMILDGGIAAGSAATAGLAWFYSFGVLTSSLAITWPIVAALGLSIGAAWLFQNKMVELGNRLEKPVLGQIGRIGAGAAFFAAAGGVLVASGFGGVLAGLFMAAAPLAKFGSIVALASSAYATSSTALFAHSRNGGQAYCNCGGPKQT